MKLYSYAMLKLAICDLCFNITLTFLLSPDVLFPLPAAAMRGLLSKIDDNYAKGTFCATIVSGMTIFTAINDCCYTRSMMVFERHKALEFIFSFKGLLVVILINVIFGIIATTSILFCLTDSKDFLKTTISRGQENYLGSYLNDSAVVYVSTDMHNLRIIPMVLAVGGGLAGFHIGNFISSYLMLKRINSMKEHMSTRTYQQQKQLTWMLISQNLYPIIAISVPLGVFGAATLIGFDALTSTDFFKHCASLSFVFYPYISTFVSFYFVRPYRQFIKRLIKRGLPFVSHYIQEKTIFVDGRTLSIAPLDGLSRRH
ncbi:unnamed protein product [Caenorhabditis auriculariae]|uniref:Uncharacterized protein n=1 Tax=Caenorhabditis auriculariae TaxID=2777116 RepID=A0A8S1HQ05_9PELO|nr:unnamed protein product [Caenorhabditis auriculariae]